MGAAQFRLPTESVEPPRTGLRPYRLALPQLRRWERADDANLPELRAEDGGHMLMRMEAAAEIERLRAVIAAEWSERRLQAIEAQSRTVA